MRCNAVLKESGQNFKDSEAWAKSVRPVSTMCLCFRSTSPFCSEVCGQVVLCNMPFSLKYCFRILNSDPPSVCSTFSCWTCLPLSLIYKLNNCFVYICLWLKEIYPCISRTWVYKWNIIIEPIIRVNRGRPHKSSATISSGLLYLVRELANGSMWFFSHLTSSTYIWKQTLLKWILLLFRTCFTTSTLGCPNVLCHISKVFLFSLLMSVLE